ncbi:MAG TPA: Rho termination factor N-terminal domain-containing protein [Solirubrobacteraceae bacterium]|jgi:transcription termination factor Rho
MAVLERSELEASPLADLHAIADQVGLDGFRRLRKADLIDTILDRMGGAEGGSVTTSDSEQEQDTEPREAGARRRRGGRSRRSKTSAEREPEGEEDGEGDGPHTPSTGGSRRGRGRGERSERAGRESSAREASTRESSTREESEGRGEGRGGDKDRIAEGVVELLGNGSAFLRVQPPDPSDEDVYISAAQVRRCELVSGDRVSGPVRTPRRSERYPSMARVDTINGVSAEAVAEGPRYDDLPVAHPDKRLELDGNDPTLKAIEWLTPLGLGSRAVIVGPSRAGKSETLRRIFAALAGREGLEVTVVLAGIRPEEIVDWKQGPVAPTVALNFAASPDTQGQAVEHAIDSARRVAVRGSDAVVLIDGLDGLHPHVARRALCAARNLAESGSLTVIATAAHPIGGESTVISLDAALTGTGRLPALDLLNSGTLRPELLVGEEEAQAIMRARAAALAG